MNETRRLTQEDWDRLLPAMQSLSNNTTNIGHAVLVEGEERSAVAERLKITKQAVSNTIRRIWAIYESTSMQGENGEILRLVNVWIPEAMAQTVLEEAAKYSVNKK